MADYEVGRGKPPMHSRFKKGVSGNPKGPPKGYTHSKTRLRRLLDLTEKRKNPVTGEIEDFSVLEQMDMAMIVKARQGDIKAYQAVLDRLEGKPSQAMTFDGKVESSNRYENLSPEEVERAKKAMLNNIKDDNKKQ